MRISKEIKVALLGIVALVVLYFGFSFLKGSNVFSSDKSYYVVYSNVDGLALSNPVMLNGIRVGAVKEMKLLTDQGNQIQVEITVMEEVQIGDSTIAALTSSDLLGSKAIILYLGNNSEVYDGGERLIPFRETSITDMLTSKAVPVIDRVDTTLVRVNRLLDSEAKDNLHSILENSKETTEALNNLIRSNQRNINAITTNLNQLVSSLRQTQQHIDRIAVNMTEITDTLKQVEINKLVNNANSAVKELEEAVTKLNSDKSSIGRMMNDDELYRNLDRSTEALNMLLRDIQANPKRYVNFSLIGRKDKYKVQPNGRVITIDEVKELQEENPDDFRRPASDTLKGVPVKLDSAAVK